VRDLSPPKSLAILLAITEGYRMRFASVAEIKDGLSKYLARAKKRNEPIVVTHHGKPYALIQPLQEGDLEELEWKQLARKKLARAWEGEEDALYDYL
jgi:prevent-host-death family protein